MQKYAVRTLYIANFLAAATEMATLRRQPKDAQAFVNAMKRVEIADRTLENELNAIAEKGYSLESALMHPHQDGNHDLIITAIFSKPDET